MVEATEEKLNENIQGLFTRSEKSRVEAMAEKENRTVSNMVRTLVLESLKRWEDSAAGRRRK